MFRRHLAIYWRSIAMNEVRYAEAYRTLFDQGFAEFSRGRAGGSAERFCEVT